MEIRPEQPGDIRPIRIVNERAFGQTQEADLVDTLRGGCDECLSLVAIVNGETAGHALFTPATVECGGTVVTGMGLAPVAVLPEYQKRGIGKGLIETGIALLRERDCPFIIVLGHPGYYPRFGFQPASSFGLRPQWEGIPEGVFMARILDGEAMRGIAGVARYRDEFDSAV